MLQWCMFGGYEGRWGPEAKIYFTMFGSCELHRPTLARQLLAMRRADPRTTAAGRKIFITVFGGTEIKCPTLAEEFLDLREAIHSGTLNAGEWEARMSELDRWLQGSVASFTLFGGFEETAVPGEDEEVESLALHRHLGNIDEESGRVLELGVGQAGSQRRAVIHQAVMTA